MDWISDMDLGWSNHLWMIVEAQEQVIVRHDMIM